MDDRSVSSIYNINASVHCLPMPFKKINCWEDTERHEIAALGALCGFVVSLSSRFHFLELTSIVDSAPIVSRVVCRNMRIRRSPDEMVSAR